MNGVSNASYKGFYDQRDAEDFVIEAQNAQAGPGFVALQATSYSDAPKIDSGANWHYWNSADSMNDVVPCSGSTRQMDLPK